MVVPPTSGASFTAVNYNVRPSASNGSTPIATPRGRMGASMAPTSSAPTNGTFNIPLSARKSQPLDLRTVERRGQPTAVGEFYKPSRIFELDEAPTFRPTEEEFKNPMEYMRKIAPEGSKYGIAKIIPPDGWNPDFAIDTERFHFRTRKQELNSVEGGTRANLNYLDQLAKFHRQHGHSLNRFPSVDKRPLDLYKLKKAVETRGGFERVCKGKKWAEIGRDLGYSGKIMSSLSTSLKNSYQKWLHPYEEYLRIAKPGVHQMLEYENGGPYTPSPGPSPMKKAAQVYNSPMRSDSPAVHASIALNSSLREDSISSVQPTPAASPPAIPLRPSSGFTPVNAPSFTAVNAPTASPAPTSFAAINLPNGSLRDADSYASPHRSNDSPMTSAKNTPDLRPSALGYSPLANGQTPHPPKRQLSHDTNGEVNGDSDASGRRSKRLKKDAAPTVAGSHMTQPRLPAPRLHAPREHTDEKPGEKCEACGRDDQSNYLLFCDSCDNAYHKHCLEPPLKSVPDYDWHCPKCLVGTGEFGFEEGGVYSLRQFQQKAHEFKENYFASKIQPDPATNIKRQASEDEIEREFWRLVESITETVEVEYGADIHSTTHGSGFPTIEKNPRNPYSVDPWNLNILPLDKESLFRHIRSDISGMTVPWLYVGMVFSTFCWHNEDHYSYSANYQHLGATKTWYGIPGEDAERFEAAMREAVPELFETQPDLLFQLVTLLPPDQLQKAGVRVYALDQRAGQFVITYPQAYHAGFNHGFNVNEAVNFSPHDWEPFGEAGVQRLRDFRRQPCFSHDELLLTAASRDGSIKTAKWLAPAMVRMREKELAARRDLRLRVLKSAVRSRILSGSEEIQEEDIPEDRVSDVPYELDQKDLAEDDYICSYCKCFSYLGRYVCKRTGRVVCLLHAGTFECCDATEERRLSITDHSDHVLHLRMPDTMLKEKVQKVVDIANTPDAWREKFEKLIEENPEPPLKNLRTLLSEGEKIQWELPELHDLRLFVERCNVWVEEAQSYITRKQQNRRKNERVWRKGTNAQRASEAEDREKDLRNVDNITKLLKRAEQIGFDCPEIVTLRERADAIADFRRTAKETLNNISSKDLQGIKDLVDTGKSFNVDIPEIDQLDKVVRQLKWHDQAREYQSKVPSFEEISAFIKQGLEAGIPEVDPGIKYFMEQKERAEFWDSKVKELISAESINYQQLDALADQASALPVSRSTMAEVDAILKKQRDARDKIKALYDKSQASEISERPQYKEVREAMEALNELNTKPEGTLELEKEQKRHEDWMRRGKKLFGKANAPLHILLQHMEIVAARNRACFSITDLPRIPAEPHSREQTPVEEREDPDRSQDVFCICRKPEAGMMVECELCHEWYHGKCLKIARGKVKEATSFTCPICDWRAKIPRDAARPKLEDVKNWQSEIPDLPFQPEEEAVLDNIVDTADEFRSHLQSYMNPLTSTPDSVSDIRFYLRKLEGADVMLVNEINFFRQELHRWAPVAPEAPPIVDVSLSTRKPRPTKQQKLMQQLGISNPDEIPPHLRSKTWNHQKRKASEAASGANKTPAPIQPSQTESHTPPGLPHGHLMAIGSEPPEARKASNTTQNINHPTFSYDAMARSYPPPPQPQADELRLFDAPPNANPFSSSATAAAGLGITATTARDAADRFDPGAGMFGTPTIGAHEHDHHDHGPSIVSPQRHEPVMFGSGGSSQGMEHMFEDLVNDHPEDAMPHSHAEDAMAATNGDKDEQMKREGSGTGGGALSEGGVALFGHE